MKSCKGLTIKQLHSLNGAPVRLIINDYRCGNGILHLTPDGYLFVLEDFADGADAYIHDSSVDRFGYVHSWIIAKPGDYEPDEPIEQFMYDTRDVQLLDLKGE